MTIPTRVNRVGGWALDIVKGLWGDVSVDEERFADLDARVIREVHFPCVIFAEFSFGLVAIDCNDCDTYEVDDPSISIYIKLQFNPRHEYRQKAVYPFTFVPQTGAFAANLNSYREQYARTLKIHSAWGKFIAVSLDRFHIAREMGRLGLPGGVYVTSDAGYEDHHFDPVKPRQRMPFAEYLDFLCKSMAVIDAKGFGDLTHRSIECLAIGAPLIRPRLDISTANPLLPSVHYLDCGHRGETLGDCVTAAQNPRLRSSLVANGQEWYDKNCTPDGMRSLFHSILHKHTSPKRRLIVTKSTPKPLGETRLHLLVGLYRDPSVQRMTEIAETFAFNLANEQIETIHVFWEDSTSRADAAKLVPGLEKPKVSVKWLCRRLLFSDLFRYANANLPNNRVIIANNDIYFGGLRNLAGYDLAGHILCLSRWDVRPYAAPSYMDCDCSQDAWIFGTPIDLDPEFPLGYWGCDGRINKEGTMAGLRVSNPSFEIFAHHNHASGVKHYNSQIHNVPDGLGVRPSSLVWPQVITPSRTRTTARVAFYEEHGYRIHRLIDGVSSHGNQHRPFTRVPPELYGLQFCQLLAWKSSPMTIECRSSGTLYILVGRDWRPGVEEALERQGAIRSTIEEPETPHTSYEVWSVDLCEGGGLLIPAQVILAAEPLERTAVDERPSAPCEEQRNVHIPG